MDITVSVSGWVRASGLTVRWVRVLTVIAQDQPCPDTITPGQLRSAVAELIVFVMPVRPYVVHHVVADAEVWYMSGRINLNVNEETYT